MNTSLLPTAEKPLRLGTRKSPLAMAQAQMVAEAICAAHSLQPDYVQIIPMLASGDIIQDRPLAEIGGKALWTKELERALVAGEIDFAVHSMKDVETVRPKIFCVQAMIPRADVRDKLIGAASINELPIGARVGTSSPRRAAQLFALRPDLKIVPLRGNVATRLAKIKAGEADATLLAAAGLDRLAMSDTGALIETAEVLPAASQGAIGIDCLSANMAVREILDQINHAPTFDAVMAERAFLAALGGDCHSPVAAFAQQVGDVLVLTAEILLPDGSERRTGTIQIVGHNKQAPAKLATELLGQASAELRAIFGK